MTVLGPVAADDLGVTLTHEHCLVDLRTYWAEPAEVARRAAAEARLTLETVGASRRNPLFSRDNLVLDVVGEAVAELAEFRALGGTTVVDVTPADIGRDVLALQAIARRTGLNVVAGCGHYIQISHPPGVADEDVDSIAERIAGELRDGVDETGVRAGVIGEVGTSNPLHPDEEKVLRAAGRAHGVTGAPIVVHLSPPGHGASWLAHEVLDVLESEGVPPGRVLLSHMDNVLAPGDDFGRAVAYHAELARRGAFVGYDGCGKEHYFPSGSRAAYPSFWCPSDRERARAAALLVEQGLGGQLLLSHDVCFKIELVRYGGFGYGHIPRTFAANLADYGVGREELERILVDNPRRFLAP
jgi:phosphotriesterase-related protein